MGELEFREGWYLLLALLAIPVWSLARRAPGRVVFSSLDALPARSSSWRTRLAWVPDALLALAVVALAVAMAGPRVGDRASRIRTEGIAIAMVVDTSSSMRALDLSEPGEQQSRLDVVKDVFVDFVTPGGALPGRPDDAVGLISFAGYADTRAPLTLDHDMLVTIAGDLEIASSRAEDGTAIGDGLGLAIERLRESEAASRVAILLTDGVNNAGELAPVAAAELAQTSGVKVYTVGAGSEGMAPVPVTDPFGRTVLRDVRVEIDEALLEDIAARTGGRYFRARDADGLRGIYEEIDRLERTELEEDRFRDYDEYYRHALALGLLLCCLGWLGRGTIWRRLP
jgi:Ca-activated chloride channel homolog